MCTCLFTCVHALLWFTRSPPAMALSPLYVLKGLSWPKGWFQKLASPVLRLTIPHRDYFNFFLAKNSKKNSVFFLYIIIFSRRRREKIGVPKKIGVQKK